MVGPLPLARGPCFPNLWKGGRRGPTGESAPTVVLLLLTLILVAAAARVGLWALLLACAARATR